MHARPIRWRLRLTSRIAGHRDESRERLEALLQEATAKELPYADFLDQGLSQEVASKPAKHITMRTHLARFAFVKGTQGPGQGPDQL